MNQNCLNASNKNIEFYLFVERLLIPNFSQVTTIKCDYFLERVGSIHVFNVKGEKVTTTTTKPTLKLGLNFVFVAESLPEDYLQ